MRLFLLICLMITMVHFEIGRGQHLGFGVVIALLIGLGMAIAQDIKELRK